MATVMTRRYLERGRHLRREDEHGSRPSVSTLPPLPTPAMSEQQLLHTQLQSLRAESLAAVRASAQRALGTAGVALQLGHGRPPAHTPASGLLAIPTTTPLDAAFLPGSSVFSRAASELRIAARRRRVDDAIGRARQARDGAQPTQPVAQLGGTLMGDRAHLLRAITEAQQELLSRFAELQLAMAINRSLIDGDEEEPTADVGIPKGDLERLLPPLAYSAVLWSNRGCALPGSGECAVCQAALEKFDKVRLLPCRHAFHVGCIDPWLERSVCCPTCRGAVSVS